MTINPSLPSFWGSLFVQSLSSEAVIFVSVTSAAGRTAGVSTDRRVYFRVVSVKSSESMELRGVGLAVAGCGLSERRTIMSSSRPDFGNLVLFLYSFSVAFQTVDWVAMGSLK